MSDDRFASWLDQCCDRLELDWSRKQPDEDLTRYLPAEAAGEVSRRLLLELVLVDLERRWRTAAPGPTASSELAARQSGPSLEDYVQRYRLLRGLEQLPAFAWEHEFRVRHRWGDRPTVSEFLARSPDAQPHEVALRNSAAALRPMSFECESQSVRVQATALPGELELGRRRRSDPPDDFWADASPRPRLIIAARDSVAISRRQLVMQVEGVLCVRVQNLGMNKVLVDGKRPPLLTNTGANLLAPFRLLIADMAIRVFPIPRG